MKNKHKENSIMVVTKERERRRLSRVFLSTKFASDYVNENYPGQWYVGSRALHKDVCRWMCDNNVGYSTTSAELVYVLPPGNGLTLFLLKWPAYAVDYYMPID